MDADVFADPLLKSSPPGRRALTGDFVKDASEVMDCFKAHQFSYFL
jgi:hypothetical protein